MDLDFLPFLFEKEILFYQAPVQEEPEQPTTPLPEPPVTVKTEIIKKTPTITTNIEALKNKPAFRYLGEQNKGILILLHAPEQTTVIIGEQEQILLENILQAGKLKLSDVAICNVAAYPQTNLPALQEHFKPLYVWIFGQMPFLPNAPELYAEIRQQAISYLYADELSQLIQDKNKKFALWQALKKIEVYQ
jgi:DNA polymerase III psi subunit